jgi:hypothetical protein
MKERYDFLLSILKQDRKIVGQVIQDDHVQKDKRAWVELAPHGDSPRVVVFADSLERALDKVIQIYELNSAHATKIRELSNNA